MIINTLNLFYGHFLLKDECHGVQCSHSNPSKLGVDIAFQFVLPHTL